MTLLFAGARCDALAKEIVVLARGGNGHVRRARWLELALQRATWTVPEERTKIGPRAPGSPVEPGVGHCPGGLAAPRRERDPVPGRARRKDQRIDVGQAAPASRHRRNAPRDEVLVSGLVIGDGRSVRGGGGGACTQDPHSGRGRLYYARSDLLDRRREVMRACAAYLARDRQARG